MPCGISFVPARPCVDHPSDADRVVQPPVVVVRPLKSFPSTSAPLHPRGPDPVPTHLPSCTFVDAFTYLPADADMLTADVREHVDDTMWEGDNKTMVQVDTVGPLRYND